MQYKTLQNGNTYLGYANNICMLNFSFEQSFKVIPLFDKIENGELSRLKKSLDSICCIDLRLNDYLGKMLVDTMYLFDKGFDIVILNLAGLSNQSIEFLNACVSKVVESIKKITILMHSPALLNK